MDGGSPAHPFGSLAATGPAFAGGPKAHSFASPSFGGFALSRMKGVAVRARTARLAPDNAAKTGTIVCYATLERICEFGKSGLSVPGAILTLTRIKMNHGSHGYLVYVSRSLELQVSAKRKPESM